MHFIYQWLAVLKDEQIVLPEALSDDFWEEVEVRFADDFLPWRQVDGLPQSLTHVNVAGVEILDHEEGPRQVFESL